MQDDSTTGLVCLIGCVHLLPTASHARITNRKPQRNEVPPEEWQNETSPFCTIHIEHKGPLHPPSNRNLHCLMVIDYFLTSTNPLFEELLSYHPTRFYSDIFDYIVYEHSSFDESVHSIEKSVSIFYSEDSTYFSFILLYHSYFFSVQLQFFLTQERAQDSKSEPPAKNDRRPKKSRETLCFHKPARVGKQLQVLPLFCKRPGGEQPSHHRRWKLVKRLYPTR